MFVLIVFTFGCSFGILGVTGDDWKIFTGFYYTYLLALGEFGLDDFEESPIEFLLTIFFILATLVIMVLMFNLLIAVICSIYEEVSS